jgi:hypothetical protein
MRYAKRVRPPSLTKRDKRWTNAYRPWARPSGRWLNNRCDLYALLVAQNLIDARSYKGRYQEAALCL